MTRGERSTSIAGLLGLECAALPHVVSPVSGRHGGDERLPWVRGLDDIRGARAEEQHNEEAREEVAHGS